MAIAERMVFFMPKKNVTIEKGTFVMRDEWWDYFKELPSDDALTLLNAIFDYHVNGNVPDFGGNFGLRFAFKSIKQSIDYTEKAYSDRSMKNALNAKIRQNAEHNAAWYSGLGRIVLGRVPNVTADELVDIVNSVCPKDTDYATLQQLEVRPHFSHCD